MGWIADPDLQVFPSALLVFFTFSCYPSSFQNLCSVLFGQFLTRYILKFWVLSSFLCHVQFSNHRSFNILYLLLNIRLQHTYKYVHMYLVLQFEMSHVFKSFYQFYLCTRCQCHEMKLARAFTVNEIAHSNIYNRSFGVSLRK